MEAWAKESIRGAIDAAKLLGETGMVEQRERNLLPVAAQAEGARPGSVTSAGFALVRRAFLDFRIE